MEQHIEPPGPTTTRQKRTLFTRPLARDWTLGVGVLVAAVLIVSSAAALVFGDSQGAETSGDMLALNVAINVMLGAATGLVAASILAGARLIVTRQRAT
jgi:hypothetical protein